jgi:hypothetical protein
LNASEFYVLILALAHVSEVEYARNQLQIELSTLKKAHERTSAALGTRDAEHAAQTAVITSAHAKLEAELSARKQEIKSLNERLTEAISVSCICNPA